jgi:hypothetical protein
MKRYKVPFELRITGSIEVDAEDQSDAMQYVEGLDVDTLDCYTDTSKGNITTEWPEEVIIKNG